MQIRTRPILSSRHPQSAPAVPRESLLTGVARWCVRHRRLVVVAWLVVLIGLSTMSHSFGSSYKDSLSLPGTQSFEAQSLLQKAVPQASGDREQIVVAVTVGKVTDPAVHRRVGAMLARVSALGDVASVASPYGPSGVAQISRSGQVAFANVTLTKQAAQITTTEAQRLVRAAKTGEGNGIQVGVEGQAAETASRGSTDSTALGAAAALVVLLLVFGSLLAASLPLLTTGIALGSSSALIALASHLLNIASFSSELSLLIGLGVGIDYALFIVTRFRENFRAGTELQSAIDQRTLYEGNSVLRGGQTPRIEQPGRAADELQIN